MKQTKKTRERVLTTSRLHEPVRVASTGNGKKISNSLRIKPGKGNIWNPNAVIDSTTLDGCVSTGTEYQYNDSVNCALAVEEYRANKTQLLRKKFKDLCKPHNLVPPIYAWERWQARSKLHETQEVLEMDTNREVGIDGMEPDTYKDPFLPSSEYLDPGLVADLCRASFSTEAATSIASELATLSKKCVEEIAGYALSFSLASAQLSVKVVEHKHSLDISLIRPTPLPGKKNKNRKGSGKVKSNDSSGGSGTQDTNNSNNDNINSNINSNSNDPHDPKKLFKLKR
jgi:hypothetical protein